MIEEVMEPIKCPHCGTEEGTSGCCFCSPTETAGYYYYNPPKVKQSEIIELLKEIKKILVDK